MGRKLSLHRRALVSGLASLGLARATAGAAGPDEQTDLTLHRQLLVLDSHVDVLLPGTPARTYAPDGRTYSELDKLKTGGVDALVYAVAVSTGPRTPAGYEAARREAQAKLAEINAIVARSHGALKIAQTAADVRTIVAEGRIAVLIGFLNAYSLGEDLSAFETFYKGGVRVAGLAHAGNTAFADSSRPGDAGEEHGGLSALGKQAVRRFNDLGVLIDISQLTPKGVEQTLALSRAPVVASHSAVRALADHTRNLSDAELDAIKAKGGVVQVTAFNSYLLPKPADYDRRLAALREQFGLPPASGYQGADALPAEQSAAFFAGYRGLTPRASVRTFADHIDYLVRRIGDDHVGVGTDFNHGAGIEGFADESQAANVTRELRARGYDKDRLARIWGGNFLRVLAAAESGKT